MNPLVDRIDGEDLADTHFALHGEGSIAHDIECRLHFGDQSIDETHPMSRDVFRDLVKHRTLGSGLDFGPVFDAWFDTVASSAAGAEKVAFRHAAWCAL